MKEAICFKVPSQHEETVRVEYWDLPYFYDPIHYHEECQLTYIQESEGMLFVGDKLDRFRKGELYLLGPKLSHVFRNDNSYYKDKSINRARAISVFFNKKTFDILSEIIPEAHNIEKLIGNSSYGIRLINNHSSNILANMKKLLESNGFSRVLELLNILDTLSQSKKIEIISTQSPMMMDKEDSQKLNQVFEYIINNHEKKITLEEVASLIYLTPTSFSRYFKSRTQKTFSQYLIEVRISNACKHLTKQGYNVAEACYASGYNNISNFHRQFQKIKGVSPNLYRKNYMMKQTV